MIILYIHGLSSSGQSGTVDLLRRYFPLACIIAPDLPLDPTAALRLLRETCDTNHPDLIIGTSMGGMFAQQMFGYRKILVNPAFRLADVLKQNKGENKFFNRRQDGVQTFIIDDALIAEYEELAARRFVNIPEGENEITFGMFGRDDDLVNDSDLFLQYYMVRWRSPTKRQNPQALRRSRTQQGNTAML